MPKEKKRPLDLFLSSKLREHVEPIGSANEVTLSISNKIPDEDLTSRNWKNKRGNRSPFSEIDFKNHKKSPHVYFKRIIDGNELKLNYDFKDHKNRIQNFELKSELEHVIHMSNRFGFPRKYVSNSLSNSATIDKWLIERDEALIDGLFKIEGNVLRPDPNQIVSFYSKVFCKQIAEQIVNALKKYKTDTRRERIEMAMKFVQDIPYAVPYQNDPNYLFAGLITPPQILYLNYGDCDSKSFLFAGILSYLIPADDIAFLIVPEHFLTIIKDEEQEGLKSIRFNNSNYILAETSGPSRNNYGIPSKYKSGEMQIETLDFQGDQEILAFTNDQNAKRKNYDIYKAKKQKIGKNFFKQIEKISQLKKEIKSIVFNDNGGWLIIADKNETYYNKIPKGLIELIDKLKAENIQIDDAALSFDDEYVLIFHNGFGFASSVYPETSSSLLPTLNVLTEKKGQPIRDVAFTHHKKRSWVVIYGHQYNGLTGSFGSKLEKSLKPAIEKAAPKGIKSISFTPSGGWLLLFGENGFYSYLPKKLNAKINEVLTKLAKENAIFHRFYFTPLGDWFIIYDRSRFLSSFSNNE